MARPAQRAEHLREQDAGVARERREQSAGTRPRRARGRPPSASTRALEHRRRPVVERVGERRVRVDRLEPVRGERERAQERRRERERMDRRAGVVDEAREGQLGRAAAAADRVRRLEHRDRAPGAGEGDRRRQAVRPGPDDDGAITALGQCRRILPGAAAARPTRARRAAVRFRVFRTLIPLGGVVAWRSPDTPAQYRTRPSPATTGAPLPHVPLARQALRPPLPRDGRRHVRSAWPSSALPARWAVAAAGTSSTTRRPP